MRQGGYSDYSTGCDRPAIRSESRDLFPGLASYQEFTGAFSGVAVGAYTWPIPARNKGTFVIMLGLDRIVSHSALLQIQRGA